MTAFRDPVSGSPPGIRVVDPAQHRIMPWKNGFGTTTEIAIDPPDADLGGRFRWRLSIAVVQRSGPFSPFPGYDRTIMVIDGSGMELAVGIDPPRRIDRHFEPFAFSGDVPAECRLLGGPIRDFNLIVDRSLRSRMEIRQPTPGSQSIVLSSAEHIIHCFAGAIDLTFGAAAWTTCTLRSGDTAVFRREELGEDRLRVTAVAGSPPIIAAIALHPRTAAPSPPVGPTL